MVANVGLVAEHGPARSLALTSGTAPTASGDKLGPFLDYARSCYRAGLLMRFAAG